MSDWILNENGAIGQNGMENNALIIRDYLALNGWSFNAISALLGNMQAESGINPARWENDIVGNLGGGFGLVQWTPATKLINWVEVQYSDGVLPSNDYTDGFNQLARIEYEVNNNIQYYPTAAFKESFREWTTSNKNPGYLAAAFMKNYERPLDQSFKVQIQRAKNARQWHIFLTGSDPGGWIPSGLLALLKKSNDRQKGVF